MSCFLIGPGGAGLGLPVLAVASPDSEMYFWGFRGSVGRLITIGTGLFMVGFALLYVNAAARGMTVLRVDDGGVHTWKGLGIEHTRWPDVFGISAGEDDLVAVLRIDRRPPARSLKVPSRLLQGDLAEAQIVIEGWLQLKRPDDWRRIASPRRRSADPHP